MSARGKLARAGNGRQGDVSVDGSQSSAQLVEPGDDDVAGCFDPGEMVHDLGHDLMRVGDRSSALSGEVLDLVCDHCETASGIAGTGRFDRGVECQKVRLRRDVVDRGEDAADVSAASIIDWTASAMAWTSPQFGATKSAAAWFSALARWARPRLASARSVLALRRPRAFRNTEKVRTDVVLATASAPR